MKKKSLEIENHGKFNFYVHKYASFVLEVYRFFHLFDHYDLSTSGMIYTWVLQDLRRKYLIFLVV